MNKFLVFLLGMLLILNACSPKISTSINKNYAVLDYREDVRVFGMEETEPDDAELLGTVKIGDSGLSTNCGLEVVIDKAKTEARKIGGNAIKITKHTPPSILGSSCHQITADILKVDKDGPNTLWARTESKTEIPIDIRSDNKYYPRFRFAVSGGWSYRTGRLPQNISPDVSDYLQKLKSGFHYDAGLSYYFSEYLGAGLRYSEYLSSNSDDGSIGYGSMSDRIRINFIGPVFSTRLFNQTKKNCLLMDLGIGYLGYRDKALFASEELTLKGGTAGFYWNIGYDIGISQHIALGFQLSLISGLLSEYKSSNGTYTQVIKLDKDTRENLSRIALSVGLRFGK
jgi:hypothetical protein